MTGTHDPQWARESTLHSRHRVVMICLFPGCKKTDVGKLTDYTVKLWEPSPEPHVNPPVMCMCEHASHFPALGQPLRTHKYAGVLADARSVSRMCSECARSHIGGT
jgi:hypothetical protein